MKKLEAKGYCLNYHDGTHISYEIIAMSPRLETEYGSVGSTSRF